MPPVHLVPKETLFRPEALEEYRRGRTDEGHLLELEPRWTRYAYRLLLALFAAALVFGAVVKVERRAHGVGVVRGGRLVAVLPAQHLGEVRATMPLRFALSPRPLAIETASAKIIAASEAREILGADGAALWTSAQPAVLVEAALPDAQRFGEGVAGRVHVRLHRERLLFVLAGGRR